jgi:hypothetical protein
MTIDEIRKEIEKDTVIDSIQLDNESLKIPSLHGKYLSFLTDEKRVLRMLKNKYDEIVREKWEYYTGKSDPLVLKQKGIDQFPHKILRQDLDIYLNSDTDVQKIVLDVTNQTVKVEMIEGFIKEINSRQWTIRNAIEWRKFTNGIN